MKKIKKGFSLAEVLIAVVIVSIIATFGFSIAKKNIEKAYDLYVYTGYKGLSDAINEAQAQGVDVTNIIDLGSHIANTLNAEIEKKSLMGGTLTRVMIVAPNNIEYEILPLTIAQFFPILYDSYVIVMKIPSAKQKDSTKQQVVMRYITDERIQDLVPVPEAAALSGFNWGTLDWRDFYKESSNQYKDIQKRIDLLPFYIDDGIVGRVIDGKYKPRKYYSYIEAACLLYNKTNGINKDVLIKAGINCYGITTGDETPGVLRVANPRKVF